MNGSPTPGSSFGLVSLGPRALAHLVAGLQVLAAFVLLFTVILDLPFPGVEAVFEAKTFAGLLPPVIGHLLAAYLIGTMVDPIAHRIWRWLGRTGPGRSTHRRWLERRTNLDEYPRVRDELEPWLGAQYWFWTSPRAASEAGDLRLRLMLGQSSALAIFLAVAFCAFGLIWVPLCAQFLPETFSCPAGAGGFSGPYWLILGGVSLLYSLCTTCGLYRVMTEQKSFEDFRSSFLIYSAAYAALFFILRWCAESAIDPVSYWWLAGGTAFGPFLGFGMLWVRLDANKHYHRLVRDASEIPPPEGRS